MAALLWGVRMPGEFRLGPWLVQPSLNTVSCNGRTVRLEPKILEVLVCLAEHAGETVSKEQLIHAVWGDTFVTDDVLTRGISELRKALEDDPKQPQVIQTIPKRGYRLLLDVERCEEKAPATQRGAPRNIAWPRMVLISGALLLLAVLGIFVLRTRIVDSPNHQITSLAVIPLSNLSGDPSQDYFAEGMTDQLITRLGQISSLRVISRMSVMQYRGTRKPLPQIARELNVDAVVEGTVLRWGDRVRITANLIQAPGDKHLWAQSYEGNLQDVLVVQDKIANAIAQQIRINLNQRPSPGTPIMVNPQAYDAYLKGLTQVWTIPGTEKSIQYFNEAIQHQPDYSDAHSGLARAYVKLGHMLALPPQTAFPKAKVEALKAIELDDTSAEAHATLGAVNYLYDWDFSGAKREIEQAVRLNPNSVFVRARSAELLSVLGRHKEAISEGRQIERIDPLSAYAETLMTERLYQARRYEEAIQQARKVLAEDPNEYIAHLYLGLSLEQKHKFPKAIEELEKAVELSNNRIWIGFVAHAKAVAGDKAGSRKILRELELLAETGYASPWWPAMIYPDLGDKDRAFSWLEKAYEGREHDLVFSNVWPMFDSLHSDPRYKSLLERVGLPSTDTEAATN